MRLMRFLVIIISLLTALPSWAQEDAAVYRVTDVVVDISAPSASQARDQAIAQAQTQAFTQLLARLGATESEARASADSIASMVKAFEVQKELALAGRYTGTFTVQFKPDAVRTFLGNKGVTYTEARSRPLVVLPVVKSKDRTVLWEDKTPWRAAWEDAARSAALVPMIVPTGDLDDIAKIGAAEALAGNTDNLQALMQKYEAGGVLVAILTADLDAPDGKTGAKIEAQRYDSSGSHGDPVRVKLAPFSATGKDISDVLLGGAKQVITQVERGWRSAGAAPSGPAVFLPIDIAIPTLAAWSQTRAKLNQVPIISKTHVVTMTRGLVHVELEFYGDIPALQTALAAQALTLEQGANGGWELR